MFDCYYQDPRQLFPLAYFLKLDHFKMHTAYLNPYETNQPITTSMIYYGMRTLLHDKNGGQLLSRQQSRTPKSSKPQT